jgi:hypothetical protein
MLNKDVAVWGVVYNVQMSRRGVRYRGIDACSTWSADSNSRSVFSSDIRRKVMHMCIYHSAATSLNVD